MFSRALVLLFLGLIYGTANTLARPKNKLLLWSFDGFWSDYLKRPEIPLPSIQKHVSEGGCLFQQVRPTFPTVTFPIHTTIVTGRYPENHGIVGNQIVTREFDGSQSWFFFKNATSAEDKFWQSGVVPIWIAAIRQGLKAGVYSWPGASVNFNGTVATYSIPFSMSLDSMEKRLSTMMDWLKNPNVDLAILYQSQPDLVGHSDGPATSERLKQVLQNEVDAYIGQIFTMIKNEGLQDKVNVIITSDHGMAPIRTEIYVGNYVNLSEVEVPEYGGYLSLSPYDRTQTNRILELLKKMPGGRAYLRKDVPDKYHYSRNARIPEIVVLANESTYYKVKPGAVDGNMVGMHGYDNDLYSMQTIMMTRGPDFKVCKEGSLEGVSRINQEDLYVLMAKLLEIRPDAHDGNLANVETLIRSGALHKFSHAAFDSTLFIIVYFAVFIPWLTTWHN